MSKNPFSQLISEKNPGDMSRVEDAAWEHARVWHLMKKLGLSKKEEREVSKACDKFCGDKHLRFDIFNDHFPTFPFKLAASRLRSIPLPYKPYETSKNYQVHADAHCFEPERYKQFERVPFVVAYRDFQSELSNPDEVSGLVFQRRGFKQGMVIHNEASEQYWHDGSCWVYKDSDGHKLYVQPFDALIVGIKKNRWKP